MLRSRLPHQSKPRITSSLSQGGGNRGRILGCASDRLAVWWLMGVVGLLVFVNVRQADFPPQSMRGANAQGDAATGVPGKSETLQNSPAVAAGQSSNSHKQRVTQQELLLWSQPAYPAVTKNNDPKDIHEWDQWASVPNIGSYRYYGKDSSHPESILHWPMMDLQTELRQELPNSGQQQLEPQQTKGKRFPSSDCLALTRKGNKFAQSGVGANQDRIAIINHYKDDSTSGDWWMGLMDGHGEFGHTISQYGLYEFPQRLDGLQQQFASQTNTTALSEAISSIFLEVHHSLPQIPGAGSTAISIWKRQNQLFISNVGDSEAFVVRVERTINVLKPIVEIVYKTKAHKPDDPVERKRIEAMGGQVQEAPAPGFSARVLIPMNGQSLDDPFANVMALAMSRSLGDFDGTAYGVSAHAHTDVLELGDLDSQSEYLVILASDGLLDRVPDLQVAQQMAESTLLTPHGQYSPLEAAELLILQSSALWNNDSYGGSYRDDISLAVHRLRIQ